MKNILKQVLEIIFGLSGAIGLIITLVYTAYGIIKGSFPEQKEVIISLALTTLFLSTVTVIVIRRYYLLFSDHNTMYMSITGLEANNKKLESDLNRRFDVEDKIMQIFHNFCHEYRDLTMDIMKDIVENNYSEFYKRDHSFKMFNIFMLSNLKEIFDILTDDECATSVKIIKASNDSGTPLIQTFMRDPVSYRERKLVDLELGEFPWYKNTAFETLIDPDNSGRYYLSNDLSKEGNNYRNVNPDWKRFYNACLVAPLRIVEDEAAKKYNMLGFICVDNFKGCFDEGLSVNIMASFADPFYNLFQLFNIYKERSSHY